jgi:hypothetical protein
MFIATVRTALIHGRLGDEGGVVNLKHIATFFTN